MAICISGDRFQVGAQAYDDYVGNVPVEWFMEGHGNDIKGAVQHYIEDYPQIFGLKPPVFYWQEMNAEYTLAELLERFLEDQIEKEED